MYMLSGMSFSSTHSTNRTKNSSDYDDDDDEEVVRTVTQAERDVLRTRLLEFRDIILHSTHERCEGMSTYVGFDMVCGLPFEMGIIDDVFG